MLTMLLFESQNIFSFLVTYFFVALNKSLYVLHIPFIPLLITFPPFVFGKKVPRTYKNSYSRILSGILRWI